MFESKLTVQTGHYPVTITSYSKDHKYNAPSRVLEFEAFMPYYKGDSLCRNDRWKEAKEKALKILDSFISEYTEGPKITIVDLPELDGVKYRTKNTRQLLYMDVHLVLRYKEEYILKYLPREIDNEVVEVFDEVYRKVSELTGLVMTERKEVESRKELKMPQPKPKKKKERVLVKMPKEKKHNRQIKKVATYRDGELVKVYGSMGECARDLKVTRGAITNARRFGYKLKKSGLTVTFFST